MIGISSKLRVNITSAAICFMLGCSSPQAEWESVWKLGDASYSQPIFDPFAWSATQFMDSPDATVGEAKLESFEADIDHDGIPELFISSAAFRGNAGADYIVFRKVGRTFFYIGDLFLHPKAFRILPLGADHRPRIVTYWRNGGGEGTLAVSTNDGHKFVVVSSEVIRPNDSDTSEGHRKYEEAFGKDNN